MSDDYDPVERDPEIDVVFQAAVAAGCDFNVFHQAADFTITATFDGENPFDLVGPIIRAGHKMEHTGAQLYVVEDDVASYYFVGRKPAVIEKLRALAKSQGS